MDRRCRCPRPVLRNVRSDPISNHCSSQWVLRILRAIDAALDHPPDHHHATPMKHQWCLAPLWMSDVARSDPSGLARLRFQGPVPGPGSRSGPGIMPNLFVVQSFIFIFFEIAATYNAIILFYCVRSPDTWEFSIVLVPKVWPVSAFIYFDLFVWVWVCLWKGVSTFTIS